MRIGEVAEKTGLSISNIRFYEKKGLIEPDRDRESKYRDYTEDDITRLDEIILYRKMDLPIETISLLVKKQISVETVMQQQIAELEEKHKMLQGSIDLCKKVMDDGINTDNFDQQKVDYYLNYVKEEEANGVKFAQMDEILSDFAVFTRFDHTMVGFIGLRYTKPWLYRAILILWTAIFIALPIIGFVDDFTDGNGLDMRSCIFWGLWALFFGTAFFQFERRKNRG